MRTLALFFGATLVLAACSSGSGTDPESSDSPTTAPAASAQAAGSGGSGFCGTVESIIEDIDAIDTGDPNLDVAEMYSLVLTAYRDMSASAPSELQSDVAQMVDMSERLAEWAKDPTGEFPLTEEESTELDEAGTRIDTYVQEECGIDTGDDVAANSGDAGIETGTDKDPENPIGSDAQHQATLTITLGGETYAETLSGEFEVSCDMYGDLETGSIGIYLSSPGFDSSVSSYDTGVEPGTYEGQIYAYALDPDLADLSLDLEEIDGTFVLDRAERMTDEEWLFAGSFSGVGVDDPTASIDATFTCVGPVGF